MFGGGIAPDLGVTPDHTAPHYFKAFQNYRKNVFFMLILNTHVYLVNDYFLTAPDKFLTA